MYVYIEPFIDKAKWWWWCFCFRPSKVSGLGHSSITTTTMDPQGELQEVEGHSFSFNILSWLHLFYLALEG